MSGDTQFVFGLIIVVAVAMASNRIRFDIIAILVVLALMLSGVMTPGEALSGFGSPVVILVAALLVVGEMLDRTGVAYAMGDWIMKNGGTNESRLLIVIMLGAALLGGIMSSTAVVAIFIPIIMRIATETNLSASRLLMPMSYAALISGMLTLIGTPPNLVVSEELRAAGYSPFGFFSFTPVGIAVLVVAIGYMLVAGRRLLSGKAEDAAAGRRSRTIREMREDYRIDDSIDSLGINAGSPLAGKTIAQTEMEGGYGVRILGILRHGARAEQRIAVPSADTELHERDVLLVIGDSSDQERLIAEKALKRVPASRRNRQRWLWQAGGVVLLIHPESQLIGKTLREVEFRSQYDLHVMGMRRSQAPLEDFEDVKLTASDSLFVAGPWSRIRQLQALHHDFIVLEVPKEYTEIVPAYRQKPVALAILSGMVLLSVFDVVPLVAAVLIAVVLAVATRCLTMTDAYRAIHWSSIVLVAGMLPLADALQSTGGTDLIVDGLMTAVGDSGPTVMFTVIFFLTAALGLFLSNTASAVLVAPIAIIAAEKLAVSPYPFAIAVLIAASAAFVTPVSTPVVTLVVEPGRYRFMDFVKVGSPLLVLAYAATVLVAPLIFPY